MILLFSAGSTKFFTCMIIIAAVTYWYFLNAKSGFLNWFEIILNLIVMCVFTADMSKLKKIMFVIIFWNWNLGLNFQQIFCKCLKNLLREKKIVSHFWQKWFVLNFVKLIWITFWNSSFSNASGFFILFWLST